jgi:hypothetical protein
LDPRDENGEWRRLHDETLHTLYRSINVGRVVKCTVYSQNGEK